MIVLLAAAALAGPWDGKNPDIDAQAVVQAPADAIFAVLLDLQKLQLATPETCIGKWTFGSRSQGEGATATVRYDIAAMHRRLHMTLARAEPGRKVHYEHAGPTGFITQWLLTPSPDGASTTVRVTTPLQAPPWPVQGYFYETVQPAWVYCQQQTIAGVARLVGAPPPT